MKCSTEYHLNIISKYEWEGNEGDVTSNSVYYVYGVGVLSILMVICN